MGEDADEKIQIINQTGEDVIIYCYYWSFNKKYPSQLTTILSDETKFIFVAPKETYYAKGKSSNKEYGEKTFVAVPSRYDVQQTWVIK
jgi:hypothetical protein